MLNKLLFIYIFSVIMFYNKSNQFYFEPQNEFLQKYFKTQQTKLLKSFKNKKIANLLVAFVSGNKKILSKKMRKNFKRKNLYHLFTPSGLHYSSIYFIIIFLFSTFIKKEKLKNLGLVLSLLSLPVLYLNRYYSLKRIILFYFLKNITNFIKRKLVNTRFNHFKMNNFSIFLAVFIIDYHFGSFNKSPTSFIYSFLFLGSILVSKDTFKSKLISIIFAQSILSIVTGNTFHLANSIQGFLLTSIFSFLFPIILLNFFSSNQNFSELFLLTFNKLVTL